jgi:GAF domain-containing protein
VCLYLPVDTDLVEGSGPPALRTAAGLGVFAGMDRDDAPAVGQRLALAAIAARQVLTATEPANDPRTADVVDAVPELGLLVAAPLVTDAGIAGALLLAWTGDHRRYSPADLDMFGTFAQQVALALQLAAARIDTERLHQLDDRLRIATELQDRVISRLFGLGLAMQGTAGRTAAPATRDAIAGHIDELDVIIRDIRSAVFALGDSEPTTPGPAAA